MDDCGGDEVGLAAETFFRFIPAIKDLTLRAAPKSVSQIKIHVP